MDDADNVLVANRAHQRVEDADSERCAASEWLRHVQLCIWIVIIVLVEKLYIGVVT